MKGWRPAQVLPFLNPGRRLNATPLPPLSPANVRDSCIQEQGTSEFHHGSLWRGLDRGVTVATP